MSVITDVTVDATLEHCRSVVAEKRSSAHPFVAELDLVSPTRRGLGRWAVAKHHQVYLQNVLFSALHLNAREHEDVRQYAMGQLVAEETGVTSGSAPHYTLMRRFAEACGAHEAELDLSHVSLPVRAYVDTLVSACRDQHFVYGLLTVYSIESQSGESAGRVLSWLRAHHDFTDAELEWFTVHAEDEDDHAADGLALIRRYAPDLPDFAERAPAVTTHICDAWLGLHDHYCELLRSAEPEVTS
jgi:pyrroloquinoline-quinone synthase